jgi:hypothetical protein
MLGTLEFRNLHCGSFFVMVKSSEALCHGHEERGKAENKLVEGTMEPDFLPFDW